MEFALREPSISELNRYVINNFVRPKALTKYQADCIQVQRFQQLRDAIHKSHNEFRQLFRRTGGDLHDTFKILGVHNEQRHKLCQGERCIHRDWSTRDRWSSAWHRQLFSSHMEIGTTQSDCSSRLEPIWYKGFIFAAGWIVTGKHRSP